MSATVYLKDRNGDEQEYPNIRGVSLAIDDSDPDNRKIFYDISDTTNGLAPTDLRANKSCYTRSGEKITGTIGEYTPPGSSWEISSNGTLATENKYCASNIVVNVPSGGSARPTGSSYVAFNDGSTALYGYYVLPGQIIQSPPSPTPPTGKVFAGWSKGAGYAMQQFPFTAPNTDVTLYAVFIDPEDMIIGIEGIAGGNIQYTDGIAYLGGPEFLAKGSITEVVSPLDSFFPFSEIREEILSVFSNNSDSATAIDNVFIKFPKMYFQWKVEEINNTRIIDGVRIARKKDIVFNNGNYAWENTGVPKFVGFLPDAFRGGDSFQKTTDYVYIGKYEGAYYSNADFSFTTRLISRPNYQPLTNISLGSIASVVSYYEQDYTGDGDHPHYRGGYGDGYQQLDLGLWTLYNFLAMIYLKTGKLYAQMFPGRAGGGTNFSYSGSANTGAAGLGPDSGGVPKTGWNTFNGAVQILGVENPYANIEQWLESTEITGGKVSVVRGNENPSNYVEIMDAPAPPASALFGFIKYLSCGRSATAAQSYAFPITFDHIGAGGYGYYAAQSSKKAVYVGGSYSRGEQVGLWTTSNDKSPNDSGARVGARLCYRPLGEVLSEEN